MGVYFRRRANPCAPLVIRRRLPCSPCLPRLAALLAALLALAACGTSLHTTAVRELRSGVTGADHVLSLAPSPEVQAARIVSQMSLDDKLGQLIIIQFTEQDYTPMQAALVQPFHPGGVILYDYAMGTADQVRALLAGAQADSPIPMLTMTDLEGGGVDHIARYVGPHISAPEMAASGDPNVATQAGVKFAQDMKSLGFNTDLAPDVDVELVDGPDQWGRTFGTTPQPVITYAGAFLRGLQSQNVVGCLKHFPGLGAATSDAHADLPEIDRTRAQIESTELAPYRALIATGQVQMIMSTDLLMPALDPNLPAEISRPIITGVLRDELHYNGVAITDALYMKGVSDKYPFVQAAVMAIEAGNDMIMAPFAPNMVSGIIDWLKSDIASGTYSMAQLDASVTRIIALKIRFHLMSGGAAPIRTGVHAGPEANTPRARPAA